MMDELTARVGFVSPTTEKTIAKRRHAGVQLIATVALAVSLIIAATAVSIGMARAQVFSAFGPPHLADAGSARIGGEPL